MMKSVLAAIAVTAALSLPAAAATIVNGSFEDSNPTGEFDPINAVSNAIPGWTVATGSVDFIGSYWQAADGNNSLDMAGDSLGSISQMITGLTAGVQYMITFAMSGNPDNGLFSKFMSVTAGGETGTYEYDFGTGMNTRANMKWEDYQFFFTAGGNSEVLTFAALTSNSTGCCWGPALDDVRISAVPLPASAPLILAGLGALAALRRRRRA